MSHGRREKRVDGLERDLLDHAEPQIEIDGEIERLIERAGELPGTPSEKTRRLHEVTTGQPVATPFEGEISRIRVACPTSRRVHDLSVPDKRTGVRTTDRMGG